VAITATHVMRSVASANNAATELPVRDHDDEVHDTVTTDDDDRLVTRRSSVSDKFDSQRSVRLFGWLLLVAFIADSTHATIQGGINADDGVMFALYWLDSSLSILALIASALMICFQRWWRVAIVMLCLEMALSVARTIAVVALLSLQVPPFTTSSTDSDEVIVVAVLCVFRLIAFIGLLIGCVVEIKRVHAVQM